MREPCLARIRARQAPNHQIRFSFFSFKTLIPRLKITDDLVFKKLRVKLGSPNSGLTAGAVSKATMDGAASNQPRSAARRSKPRALLNRNYRRLAFKSYVAPSTPAATRDRVHTKLPVQDPSSSAHQKQFRQ